MIPALAFNEAKASITNNINTFGDHLASVMPELKEFSCTSQREKFKAKTSAIITNGLIVNVASHNGIYIDHKNPGNMDLFIPTGGYIKADIDHASYELEAEQTALISCSERRNSFSDGSNVIIRLDKHKLDTTCASMLAKNSYQSPVERSQLLPMNFKNISFFRLFQTIFNQIDIVGANPDLLNKLAFDDRVYRLSAGLIYPNLLLLNESVDGRRPQVTSEIDMLCEYLRAGLKRPITLTEMEQMSGLPARKLQFAFIKAFGMDARDWLKKQRLHAARSALLDTHEQTTIAFVAYNFCFISAAEFSRHYKQEFGELPEQTIRSERSE